MAFSLSSSPISRSGWRNCLSASAISVAALGGKSCATPPGRM
ncbi:Uncharacterised protein [Mycobacterium tuberculosis]|nr:Uncharacterised protein [Mycobacterium tuberculosis]